MLIFTAVLNLGGAAIDVGWLLATLPPPPRLQFYYFFFYYHGPCVIAQIASMDSWWLKIWQLF